MIGYCSKCHKVWMLEERQGVCSWCNEPASCITATPKPRRFKSRSNGKERQVEAKRNGYDQLTGEWLTYYKVASRYESKIPAVDRDDFRHDCMLELERATRRDGKPLPELRAYRIASLMVALYFRKLNRFSQRVCIYNGYPVKLHCKGCGHDTDSKRCVWLAVRPVQMLEDEVVDNEGYRATLLDTVASDKVTDMPELWYDAKTLADSLPLRLVEIAYKRLEGKALTNREHQYLWYWRKRSQKTLELS
jgi:hypothetical protein